MIRSFELKLALLSTVVSGVVLTVFGLVFWHFVEQSHLQRLDRDLASLAHQLLTSGSHSLEELHLSAEQVAIYGEELESAATLLTDRRQRIVHQSENWPSGVNEMALPEATQVARTKLPPREHGPHAAPHASGDRHEEHLDHEVHSDHATAPLVEPHYKTVENDGAQWRLIGLKAADHTLHVALDLARFNANLHHVRVALVLAIGVALVVSALGGGWIARRALRPVRTLTELAEGVTATELGQRLDDRGADLEFARLIRVFNEMLQRLDASFRQATRFSADASHELKTPLAVMRGEVETALQRAPAGSDVQLVLASQLEEIQRLNNLVGKLLLLSHADSGALRPSRERFDFRELVARVCEDIPALDPDLTVECLLGNTVELVGDQDLLRQIVQNLVVNAVSYNRPDGWVRCELERSTDTVVLRIANSAKPIPGDQREKIFRRFYRMDESRTGDHAGLGLSLAREITRVHGGQLMLAKSDETGTVFELTLPAKTV